MHKNGFTLPELLAVITILAVVMLIGSVSINGIRRKTEENMFKSKLELILGSAQDWGQNNKDLLTNNVTVNGNSKFGITKTIADFIENEYIVPDKKNCTKDESGLDECSEVVIDNIGQIINDTEITVYISSQRVYACVSSIVSGSDSSLYEDYMC